MLFILVLSISIILQTSVNFTVNSESLFNEDSVYGLGAIVDDISNNNFIIDNDESNSKQQNIKKNRTLPQSVDLSLDDAFPCIRSQGSIGSCASWASTYYQFGYQVAALNGWNAKNNASLQFSPKFIYNLVNNGIDKGSRFEDNYFVLKKEEPLNTLSLHHYRQMAT